MDEIVEIENPTDAIIIRPQPDFPRDLIVTEMSLVVDRNGVSWWVNPHSRQIIKASPVA